MLLILMGVLVLYLVVDFGRQVGVSHQRREELRQIEYSIMAANEEGAQLLGELEYATSPEAAEAWARRNGLTRPGEVLVVPVGPSEDSEAPVEQQPEAGAAFDQPREAWLHLFFGTR
jgi:hypothetical protein